MTTLDVDRAEQAGGAISSGRPRRPGMARLHVPGRQGGYALKRWYRWIVGGILGLALVASGLLPPSLGGSTTLLLVQGISMLPHFHTGELVILRKESTYHVGEVAAYHNGQLGAVVMHRIVRIGDGHFVFKGDNNNVADSFEPTKNEIVGAEWLALPGLGRVVEKLRVPLVAAGLLGLLWLFSFSPRPRSRRQRRRHGNVR